MDQPAPLLSLALSGLDNLDTLGLAGRTRDPGYVDQAAARLTPSSVCTAFPVALQKVVEAGRFLGTLTVGRPWKAMEQVHWLKNEETSEFDGYLYPSILNSGSEQLQRAQPALRTITTFSLHALVPHVRG